MLGRARAMALVAAVAAACGGSDDGDAGFGNGAAGASAASGASSGGFGGSSAASGASFGGFGGSAAAAGSSGGSTGGSSGLCGTNLTGTLRDFRTDHPDFEYVIGVDPGIVQTDLGSDGKPVYDGNPDTPTTTGQANFDQWYRDVPGTNWSTLFTLTLTSSGGDVHTFDDQEFFPLDDQLFGNEGNPHNYHFTYELHTKFLYQGGETFSFTGDDDLFTFINGKLAIDLGGVHGALSQSIDLDARAAELGITPGSVYPLDFFFAERHTVESNFRVDTTLTFVDCGEPPE